MNWKQTRVPIGIALPLLVGTMIIVADQSARASDAELAGVIRFDGPRPLRPPIDMTPTKGGAANECSILHKTPVLTENAIVSPDGELANVFIYIRKGLEKGKKYPMPDKAATLDQLGCMYRPRVQGVRVGQDLVIKNSDKLTHNTRSYAFRNRAFNIAQPVGSEERTKVFKRPERAIQMGCDLHGWMKAYVFAMDHPFFAVSDEKGRFKIEGVPAGEYTVAAWHEKFGEQKAKITIGETGSTEVGFTFKKKRD